MIAPISGRWLCCALVIGLGCVSQVETEKPPELLAPTPASVAGAETVRCPRVERAQRMWSGFLVDVPSAVMVQALDVVVPIQEALGMLFCPAALHDCRPVALLSIELTDANANEAHVLLRQEAPETRELSLTLRLEAEAWGADPTSLARYLVSCRSKSRAPEHEAPLRGPPE